MIYRYIYICPFTSFLERAVFFRSVEEEKLDQLRTVRCTFVVYFIVKGGGGEGWFLK